LILLGEILADELQSIGELQSSKIVEEHVSSDNMRGRQDDLDQPMARGGTLSPTYVAVKSEPLHLAQQMSSIEGVTTSEKVLVIVSSSDEEGQDYETQTNVLYKSPNHELHSIDNLEEPQGSDLLIQQQPDWDFDDVHLVDLVSLRNEMGEGNKINKTGEKTVALNLWKNQEDTQDANAADKPIEEIAHIEQQHTLKSSFEVDEVVLLIDNRQPSLECT